MDVARLGFEVPTDGIEKGVTALNKLIPAAKQAETAAAGVSNAAAKANTSIRDAASGLPGLTSGVTRAASGMSGLQSALAATAAASNTSARAALAAGTSLGNMGGLLNAAAQGQARLQQQTTAATGAINSQVQALNAVRSGLTAVPAAANNATSSLNRLGAAASDNINRMQATPGNIAAQFQDIGVTAAGGMSPMLIALQQGTQLSAAFAGGLGGIGAALKQVFSPMALMTIGLVALIAYGIQWAMEALNASDATDKLSKKLEEGSRQADAFGNAQSMLASLFDITTGKMTEQNSVLSQSIKLQAQQNILLAQKARIEASNTLKAVGRQTWMERAMAYAPTMVAGGDDGAAGALAGVAAGNVAEVNRRLAPLNDVMDTFANKMRDSKLSVQGLSAATDEAVGNIDKLAKAGKLAGRDIFKTKNAILDLARARQDEFANTDVVTSINQGRLTGSLITPGATPKPRKPAKGPKSDAEKLVDVFAGAQADIATEKARELSVAVGLNIDTAAALVQETKLLNQIQQKGIPITEAVAQRVKELATAYGQAKLAADTAEAFGKSILATEQEKQGLINQRELIGKYGEELMLLKKRQDLITGPQQRGIKFDDAQVAELEKRAKSLASGEYSNLMKQVNEDRNKSHTEQMRQLSVEQAALGLTGEALVAYQYEQKAITDALARGIAMKDINIAKIREEAAAYAQVRTEIDHTASRMAAMNGLVAKSPLGGLFGALRSDDPTSALLNMGGLGSLAGLMTSGGQATFAKQGEQIAGSLKKVFPQLSDKVAGGVSKVFQGAGILSAASEANAMIGKMFGFKGGPLGILTGPIEKLLNPNRTANAVVTSSGMTVGGKDKKSYGAANDLGSSLTNALSQLADQLDTTLDAFKISIGTRGDEIRVNAGGTSLKSKNGAKGFGEDQEAALAYAVQQAISQGAFKGLSEGIQKYLADGAGEIAARLSDVLMLKGAQDQLAQAKDPRAFELGQLDKEFDNLRKIATAVGEGLADVEELYGIRRKEIAEKYAAEVSEAESAALDLSRQRREMEIELMRLNGDEIGALAAARQMEREELDPTLHGLYDLIAARQDEISANEKAREIAAAAAEEHKRLTEIMADLEIRLAEARGDTALVQQLERTRELNGAITETEREMLRQIHATETLTTAARAAADEQTRLADSMANLTERLARASGNDALATMLERNREISQASTQEEKDMLGRIFAVEDLATAYDKQSTALQEVIDRTAEAVRGLREYADSLSEQAIMTNGEAQKRRIQTTMERAARGDKDAAGALTGMIDAYLPNALRAASSGADYDAELAYLEQGTRTTARGMELRGKSEQSSIEREMRRLNAEIERLTGVIAVGNEENLETQKTIIRQGNVSARTNNQLTGGGYATRVTIVDEAA